MMKFSIIVPVLGFVLLTPVAIAEARTWTSADGSKSFEADYLSSSSDSVRLRRKGKAIDVSFEHLSEADLSWIRDTVAAAESLEKFTTSSFGKSLKKLQKLKGKRFTRYQIETPPKYFILYFSASW